MSVSIDTTDGLVFLRIASPIAPRDGTAWADEVTRIESERRAPVHIVAELEAAVVIPLDIFLCGCRKALDVRAKIASLAFVVHSPAERTLVRAAAAVIAPMYPVAYFEDVAEARAWTLEHLRAKAS